MPARGLALVSGPELAEAGEAAATGSVMGLGLGKARATARGWAKATDLAPVPAAMGPDWGKAPETVKGSALVRLMLA